MVSNLGRHLLLVVAPCWKMERIFCPCRIGVAAYAPYPNLNYVGVCEFK